MDGTLQGQRKCILTKKQSYEKILVQKVRCNHNVYGNGTTSVCSIKNLLV